VIQEQIELFTDNRTVAVIGDLNGRVGLETDFISGEAIDAQLQDNISFINYVIEFQKRQSEDTKTPNNFSRRILQLCMSTGLHICNGRFGHGSRTITFNNKNGCSTIDYLLISGNEMSNVVKSFPVCKFNQYSCYAPIEAIFYLKGNEVNKNICACSNHMLDIFKWNDESEDEVKNNILLNAQKFENVLQIIDENTGIDQSDESLNILLTYIYSSSLRSLMLKVMNFVIFVNKNLKDNIRR